MKFSRGQFVGIRFPNHRFSTIKFNFKNFKWNNLKSFSEISIGLKLELESVLSAGTIELQNLKLLN